MAKEYDTDHLGEITPEKAWETVASFIKETQVGDIDFMAFCFALELRQASVDLSRYQYLSGKMKNKGKIPKDLSPDESKAEIESNLRQAEVRNVMVEVENSKNESIYPGYTNALVCFLDLIHTLEKDNIETSEYKNADPILQKLRRTAQVHDFLAEDEFEVKFRKMTTG